MLPFENMVADYVKETENHVLYRVTPVFKGNNLLAGGVQIEAMSVEDEGESILFNVYCYNVQPGITIDYATGENQAEEEAAEEVVDGAAEEAAEETSEVAGEQTYILNTNTKKFHYPDCYSVNQMSEKNKQEYTGSREDLIVQGYDPCGNCNPQGYSFSLYNIVIRVSRSKGGFCNSGLLCNLIVTHKFANILLSGSDFDILSTVQATTQFQNDFRRSFIC